MSSDRIRIVVNGKDREFECGRSVAHLLHSLGLQPGLVVVEKNREILDRDRLDDVRVDDGDAFELVHFVGGG